ncbi:MAG: hypothetical protein JWP94_1408 [Mucilaginibacter sp.]|nr:hypothetical protein [Mucilaginibacter sp.]
MEYPDDNTAYPKFISNDPFGVDLFEGKAQEKVADKIADILQNNLAIKVIGIDGGWGSGKSNLIEIIKKKLNAAVKYKFYFFIYDAWGHQEDLQRRSLLEEMTFFLTKKDEDGISIIYDDNKWQKKLKELLAKSKETEKKTIPSLSLGIVCSVLALIITPLFNSISDLFERDWLKILITSIPLTSLIILFLYYYFYNTSKSNKLKQRVREAGAKLFYIYQQNQKQEITFEKISEDEPSVKKFRDWMKEISDDLKDKNLLLVFDNMDRLPNGKILELWSSIHTFFAENSYHNIKVIIPFDRQNIKSAFENSNDNNNDYTDDYINKTFNIVYRVSPPILSDWKKFFEIKWKEAFSEIDEEFVKVIQVFDHLSTSKTPREIVAFINEFVASAQVCTEVPYRYISLFIISKQIILINPENEIINPTYLKSLWFLYESDEELPKYIASLVYQIDPDRALEVIFTKNLTFALNNNEKNQIKNISESKFFIDILTKAIIEVENYENATLGLNEIYDKVPKKTWDDLYQKMDPKVNLIPDAKIQPYHIILLTSISNKRTFLKNTLARFRKSNQFISLDYYTSIKKIDAILKENNIQLKINEYLAEKLTTAEDFVSLIKATKDINTYEVRCNNVELNDFLDNINDADELNNSSYLSFIPEKYNLTRYITSLENKIKTNQSNRTLVAAFYTAYKNVSKTTLKVLIDDNVLYSHVTSTPEAKDKFYYDLINMRIARWNTFATPYVSYFDDILKNTDATLVSNLAEGIEYFVNYGDLLIKYLEFQKPALNEVIKSLTTKSTFTQKLSIVAVLKQIDPILEKTEINPKSLLNRLSAWDPKPITEKDIPDILKNIEFFKLCETISNALTIHCVNVANEYFDSLSDNEWLQEFQNPQSGLVVISLTTLKNLYSTKAVSAIKEVLLKIAKCDIAIPDKAVWDKIIEKTNKSSLKSAIKDVRDLFINTKEIDSNTFLFFGDWLFNYGEMESTTSALRRIFRKTVLEDESCVKIILKHEVAMSAIYENSEEKEDFDNEMRVLLDENKPFVIGLANLLNIHVALKE